jgi:glycerol-3-phosphate dehydrogenase subunit B
MPQADVVVVGAGLSGMVAAIGLAEAGLRVEAVATGHAATHWASGGLDVGALPGAATPRDAVHELSRRPGHPYAFLAPGVETALDWFARTMRVEGVDYAGHLDSPIRPVPTSLGALRPAAILPDAQIAALRPWSSDERLVVCGPARFKDYWPEAIAAGLRRPDGWPGADRPVRVDAVTFEAPGFRGRRNYNALDLAQAFDDPAWRETALVAIGRALEAGGRIGPGRVALPACLGLQDHPAALAEARAVLPLEPFEVPLVPPSIPGLRLFQALRAALRRSGGRLQVGEGVRRVDVEAGRVVRVATPAAAREHLVGTRALVIGTGGIAGGGIVAAMDGTLRETVLGLPVEAAPVERWLADDPFDPTGHPLESAGVRTDDGLRPIAPGSGGQLFENVRIVGSLLAGQRYLRERCGDGVALASGRLAAELLAEELTGSGRANPAGVLAGGRA